MGRARNFDEAGTLRAAGEVFGSSGYEGTSVDDLVAALNLHRGSLYNAYGSKRGLFLATLRHHLAGLPDPAAGDPGVDRTRAMDLLLIAAVERGPVDPEIAGLVRETLDRLDGEPAEAPPAGPALTALGNRLLERLSTIPSPSTTSRA